MSINMENQMPVFNSGLVASRPIIYVPNPNKLPCQLNGGAQSKDEFEDQGKKEIQRIDRLIQQLMQETFHRGIVKLY